MSFKDMLNADIHNVFINLNEFGELRKIEYDGDTYEDVPVVITREKTGKRHVASTFTVKDHAQGLMLDTVKVHVKRSSLGDLPELYTRIYISDTEDPDFMHSYYVSSVREDIFGMVILELEEIDE